jgi:hypothetical protein
MMRRIALFFACIFLGFSLQTSSMRNFSPLGVDGWKSGIRNAGIAAACFYGAYSAWQHAQDFWSGAGEDWKNRLGRSALYYGISSAALGLAGLYATDKIVAFASGENLLLRCLLDTLIGGIAIKLVIKKRENGEEEGE